MDPTPYPVYPVKNGWIISPPRFFRGFTLLGNDDGTWLDTLKMLGSVAATRIREFHPKDTGHVGRKDSEKGFSMWVPHLLWGIFIVFLF